MLSEKRDNKIPEFTKRRLWKNFRCGGEDEHLTLYRADTSLVSCIFRNEQSDLQANSRFTLEASTLVLQSDCELYSQSFQNRNE